MNKELTPLEALHKIANVEMKEQYKASKNCLVYRVISDEYSKELNTIEKSLKALEIIKNKFHLHIVKDEKNGNFYAMVMFAYKDFPQYCIYETNNKEEYDLLKEVLL